MEEKKKQSLNDTFQSILRDRQSFESSFTEVEKKLFNKLCIKHGFHSENFPGVLHLDLIHSDLIITPPQLWQLWVFNEITETYAYCSRRQKPPRIWLDRTKERFMDLRKKGVLRIKVQPTEPGNYIFTMYDYIEKLNECGILLQLGTSTKKFHEVCVNRLPTFSTHKENALLNMCFSGYTHEILKEIRKTYYTKLVKISDECLKQLSPLPPKMIGRVEQYPMSVTQHPIDSEPPTMQPIPTSQAKVSLIGEEYVNQVNRMESYRAILNRCKNSERLNSYPIFHSHIQRAEAIYTSYDKTKTISWEEWSLLFANIENMKHALLVE